MREGGARARAGAHDGMHRDTDERTATGVRQRRARAPCGGSRARVLSSAVEVIMQNHASGHGMVANAGAGLGGTATVGGEGAAAGWSCRSSGSGGEVDCRSWGCTVVQIRDGCSWGWTVAHMRV